MYETFAPDYGLMAWSSHRPRQQLCNLPLQTLIRGITDRILHTPPLLQRFVDLRLSKSCVGPKDYFLTQLLLPLNFWQQQFFPILGTVRIARSPSRQKVALAIEQQQR
jgi:hypothetical protein